MMRLRRSLAFLLQGLLLAAGRGLLKLGGRISAQGVFLVERARALR